MRFCLSVLSDIRLCNTDSKFSDLKLSYTSENRHYRWFKKVDRCGQIARFENDKNRYLKVLNNSI